MFTSEVIHIYRSKILEKILKIDRDSFPDGWGFKGEDKYYQKKISDKKSLNIVLKKREKIIGYLLAIPQHIAIRELGEDSIYMKRNGGGYYIETVSILPFYQKKGGFSVMLQRLKEELANKSIRQISLHARISNGFSRIIRSKMKVSKIKRIKKWRYYNFQEPTDYIEATLV